MAEDKKVVIAELDINVDLVIKKQRELTVEIENAKKIKIGPCVSISAPAASQNDA
jgi:arginine decarboxylase-like protein